MLVIHLITSSLFIDAYFEENDKNNIIVLRCRCKGRPASLGLAQGRSPALRRSVAGARAAAAPRRLRLRCSVHTRTERDARRRTPKEVALSYGHGASW